MQSKISRRNFLGNASLGLGAFGLPAYFPNTESIKAPNSFAHQVTIGTISVMDISVTFSPDMAQKVIGIMENIIPYQPDIICLPERFALATCLVMNIIRGM